MFDQIDDWIIDYRMHCASFYKRTSGEPLMTLEDWKIDVPVQIKDLVGDLASGAKNHRSPLEEQQANAGF